jgi:hypothetical protein
VPFVPDHFAAPVSLDGGWCRLRPLSVTDNEADFAAWHSSIEHIRSTPGYPDGDWPALEYTRPQNQRDLAKHEADFAARRGFTYTVLCTATGDVIGCVYIYPPKDPAVSDADVQSWVRVDHAARDGDLFRLVSAWLAEHWPFTRVSYASRS